MGEGPEQGRSWELEGSGWGRLEGESIGKDNWNQGNVWDEVETLYNGNSHKSMKVSRATGDTEPIPAISSNQARLPGAGIGTPIQSHNL